MRFACLISLLLFTATAARPAILRVKPDAPGPQFDGQTWGTAYPSPSSALNAAKPGDEVWVAAGAYKPVVAVNISLYGGFRGTETARDQRNPAQNPTVLDGEGVMTVVVFIATLPGVTLDGFTIRNGRWGVYCDRAPTISHNTIVDNRLVVNYTGAHEGGGIYCATGSTPVITGNVISHNTATWSSAIYVDLFANVTLTNNVIAANASPTFSGIYALKAQLNITGNTVVGNSGYGMYLDSVTATVANNIIAFNGRSGFGTSPDASHPSTFTLSHNDVYGNTLYDYQGLADPTGTDGNLRADPLFVDRGTEDYRLQPASPCIDVGDDSAVAAGETDLLGKPRIQGSHVDLGAYEFPQGAGFSLVDAARALKAAAGLATLSADELAHWNVETDGVSKSTVDLADAIRLVRKAAGLDP